MHDVISLTFELERWKVSSPEPFFIGNFIKAIKKLCCPSLTVFNTGGHILLDRVPDRTAIVQMWANKRSIKVLSIYLK